MSPSTQKAGYWAALFATVLSLVYIVGQLAEWAGWMGSGGGAENASTLLGIIVLLTPSLFLAPAFVVLIAAVHIAATDDKKVWSLAAVAFATAYAVLVGLNYYVQLTLIAPRMASGRVEGIEMFLFTPFDSFSYSMDILGYSFMSVATLLAALTLEGAGPQRVARWFLVANGLLLPFLLLQIYWHWLIWIAALWAVTFPGATWRLALLFRRAQTSALMIALIAVVELSPLDAQEPQPRTRRKLTDTIVTDGIRCAPTGRAYAEFHPSGRLAECPLASDTTLFDQEFPARTWVGFTDEGKLRTAWLVRDTELSGIVCKGVGYKGYSVRFHPSGALELCFLAADAMIDGIPCLHGSFWTELRGGGKSVVMLRENGRLLRCQAASDFSRDGVGVRRWQVVTLDQGGRISVVK